MKSVSRLEWEETVQFDSERLERLCAELGDDGAELTIANALEQIALKVARLELSWQAQDLAEIAKLSRSVARVADSIGMMTLADVARDVEHCATRVAPVPLAATLGRLKRLGDMSVHAIWSLEDISV